MARNPIGYRRRKGSKKAYPIMSSSERKGGSAFNPEVAHPRIAAEVHASSVADSKLSAEQLERDFRGAGPTRREEIRKATQLEANRLFIDAHNHNNSPEVRRNLEERSRVFEAAAKRMQREEKASRASSGDPVLRAGQVVDLYGKETSADAHIATAPDGRRYIVVYAYDDGGKRILGKKYPANEEGAREANAALAKHGIEGRLSVPGPKKGDAYRPHDSQVYMITANGKPITVNVSGGELREDLVRKKRLAKDPESERLYGIPHGAEISYRRMTPQEVRDEAWVEGGRREA